MAALRGKSGVPRRIINHRYSAANHIETIDEKCHSRVDTQSADANRRIKRLDCEGTKYYSLRNWICSIKAEEEVSKVFNHV